MDMQDNEMDDLFRSKLEDLEVTPSAGVWNSIDERLGGRSRRKLPYLNIAASILIMATAGFLFFRKYPVEPVKPGKKTITDHRQVAANIDSNKGSLAEKGDSATQSPVTAPGLAYSPAAPAKTAYKRLPVLKNPIATGSTEKKPDVVQEPGITGTQHAPELVAKAAVPDVSFAPTAKAADVTGDNFAPKQPVLTADLPINTDSDSSATAPRHKIHNIGDLINVMIAKVDKRRDKIIQFTDNDDNEASLTGINLGFIKIKKEK